MKETVIGIPRALLYYKYHDLWMAFFEQLHCKVILSPQSNQTILANGSKYVIDEACLPIKLYMGHVKSLENEADYILIPRIDCLKKGEQVCTNFNALYDLVHNLSHAKLLHYNIDIRKQETELFGFIQMGKTLGYSYVESVQAYHKAKEVEKRKKKERLYEQLPKLYSSNLKILLVGHPYNLYDKLIGEPIILYLQNQQVDIIYSDVYPDRHLEDEYREISNDIYWSYNKEILGAITHYKAKVDGIILLTTFPCGPDSLSNEMCLRKVKTVPIMSLIIDELNGEAGLITRLESFIDIIKEKKRRLQNEKEKNR